ncbi:MAG: PA14 domain-containing protein, partial [Rufibacter sp.]
TFAAAAGVPAPAKADGVSLLPGLTKSGAQPKSLVYVEYFNNGKSPDFAEFHSSHQNKKRNQMQLIRLDDFAGVRYDIQGHADDFEIYNVEKDPQQIKNLAKEPGMAQLQQQMKDKVLQSRMPDTQAARPYDNESVPAVAVANTKPGLTWKAFNGNFGWVPQVVNLKPSAEGQTGKPDAAVAKDKTKGALYFEGYVKVPADGTYTFTLTTDKGAVLRLHDALVIDADYGYAANSEKQGKINLKAGLHPIKLYSLKGATAKPQLMLQWEGPGVIKQQIPATAFVRVDK